MTTPEDQVHDALRREVERPRGLFRAVTGSSVAEAHGQIEDVIHIPVAEGVDIYELRSLLDERPKLDVTNEANATDWLRESLGTGLMPGVFSRGSQLVRVPRIGEDGWIEPAEGEDTGPAQVRRINDWALADITERRFWTYHEKREKTWETDRETKEKSLKQEKLIRSHAGMPRSSCAMAVNSVSEWAGVPEVVGVTHTPTVRVDGTLLQEPGYDVGSKVLYLPDPGFQPLELPPGEMPAEWVAWAGDTLSYLIQDFPFETEGHRANMLALLVTPMLRRVVPPPYPMFLLNAHQRGTGKSLLARLARVVHGGLHRPELSTSADEIRKQITSVLLTTTAPVVVFDNVTQPIKAGEVANLLTTSEWSERLLGGNETPTLANDRVWVATGNNLRVGGDLARRVQWVTLDARMPKPEYRTGFAERDLVGYAQVNRGALVSALLVLVLRWVDRGMPVRETRSDDYARWQGAKAEILEGAGLGEGFGALESVDADLSDDEIELGELLHALLELSGGREFTVRDVRTAWETGIGSLHLLVDDALPGSVKGARDMWKSLGRYLVRHEKTFAGDLRVVKAREARGGIVWQLEQMPGSSGS